MAFTQITSTNITPNTVVAYAEYAAFTANVLPKISSVQYADDTFTVLDDTAANTGGTARLIVNGSGFQTGATVIVGTTSASSTARVSAEQLRANVTALSAGSYSLYVQNPDGGTAIRVAGVTFSNTPVWGTSATLSNQLANTSFNVSISATSDSNITYSNTTSLPAGTTLLSNGYFYGTVTISTETNYTFTVKATDVENQDNSRQFSLTVTIIPRYFMYTWGGNNSGHLGHNGDLLRSSPTQVGTGKWSSILHTPRSGGGFLMGGGIQDDGTLWLWGDNSYGKLGLSDEINRSSPVQVGASTNWLKVATTYRGTTAAIKTDNSLWVWGAHTYGLLAVNVTYPGSKSSPSQIGSTVWSDISSGQHHFLAVKTDGTLWGWGNNSSGQLGHNDKIRKSSPVQVGTSTNWSNVMCGNDSTFARKTDGTLWSWGFGNGNSTGAGLLGLNSAPTYVMSPTQIGTGTNWTANVSTSGIATLAVKSDGTLWALGGGYFNGVKGLDNNLTYTSSPIQVGTATNWKYVTTAYTSTLATKTDGTLWAWGGNNNGQLGFNDRVNKSSPTQIGTETTWDRIGSNYGSSMATKST